MGHIVWTYGVSTENSISIMPLSKFKFQSNAEVQLANCSLLIAESQNINVKFILCAPKTQSTIFLQSLFTFCYEEK